MVALLLPFIINPLGWSPHCDLNPVLTSPLTDDLATMPSMEGKRYLRVYIQIRFRHACHETRDRQSRSLVSGQEEGWGEVKVLLKF